MKKMLFCCACMLLIFAGAMAQNRQGRRPQQGNGDVRRSFQPAAVIDTSIINHMDLSEELLTQVYALQVVQDDAAKKYLADVTPQRGTRPTPESMQQMATKIQELKTAFRKQLRMLIGDEKYIVYLEKSLDNRGNMMRQWQGGQRQGGGNWGGGQQGGGNWGGGQQNGFEGGF